MARHWKPRQAPGQTSITEIARRYHAAAVALAQTLGLSLPEVLTQHRESVTAIFIECGRCDLRLPAAVTLPPLSAPTDQSNINANNALAGHPEAGEIMCNGMPSAPEAPPTNGHAPPPVTIPKDAGLPCSGVAIKALKPAQLAMLVGKVARLVHDNGDRWVPLLAALQAERAGRLERGRKTPVEG